MRAIICFFCVGAYIGVALALYAIFNKIDQYCEADDYLGDGDTNKVIAGFWPVTVPFVLVSFVVCGFVAIMDLIREYQDRRG